MSFFMVFDVGGGIAGLGAAPAGRVWVRTGERFGGLGVGRQCERL